MLRLTMCIIAAILIAGKLVGWNDMSWWLVTLPLWVMPLIGVTIMVASFSVVGVMMLVQLVKDKLCKTKQ